MNYKEIRDFKPALRFVGWFLSIYLAGNLLYGLYIEWYNPMPDPVTVFVTRQSAAITNYFSPPVSIKPSDVRPIVCINRGDQIVLNVFEGCNGVNVMIVFVAFVVAFGGARNRMLVFVPAGLVIIHLANLARINLLYYTAVGWPKYFYYFHKYFFTACIYVVVFILWYLWIRWAGKKEVHVPV